MDAAMLSPKEEYWYSGWEFLVSDLNLASEYFVCAGALITLLDSKVVLDKEAVVGVLANRPFGKAYPFVFDWWGLHLIDWGFVNEELE